MTVNVGDAAPDFTLVSSADMGSVSLSDFSGEPVVLVFFPAAFSGVCKTELCTFRDSLSTFEAVNARVIGISIDPPMSQKEFTDQNNIPFLVLSDLHGKAIHDYGVEFENFAKVEGYTVARRSVFVIGKDGKVTYRWLADAPGNEPPYEEVKSAVAALG